MATNIPAVFGLNRYLWAKIQEAMILDPANYNGLTPIIPVQEVPEFLQAIDAQDGIKSYPYIVYTWNTNGYEQQWFVPSDQIIYQIHSTDNKKLRELILLITDHFKRFDESARAVNSFIQNSPLNAEYKSYDYKFISVQQAQGGWHTQDENAPIKATITVKATYSANRDNTPL